MCTKTNLDWLHVLCVSNHSQASTPCSRYCKENATVWSLGTWLATCTYIHVVTLKWFWWILGATRWTQSVLMRVWATPHPLQCGQCRGLSTVCKLSCKHMWAQRTGWPCEKVSNVVLDHEFAACGLKNFRMLYGIMYASNMCTVRTEKFALVGLAHVHPVNWSVVALCGGGGGGNRTSYSRTIPSSPPYHGSGVTSSHRY